MSESDVPEVDRGGKPLLSRWHQDIVDTRKNHLDELLKHAVEEKPELNPAALRLFIRKYHPYWGSKQTKDYAESLLAMILVHLEKKKSEKAPQTQ